MSRGCQRFFRRCLKNLSRLAGVEFATHRQVHLGANRQICLPLAEWRRTIHQANATLLILPTVSGESAAGKLSTLSRELALNVQRPLVDPSRRELRNPNQRFGRLDSPLAFLTGSLGFMLSSSRVVVEQWRSGTVPTDVRGGVFCDE